MSTKTSQAAFQIGDEVICIDDEASFGRLYRGATYRVEANFDGSPTVISRGSSHSIERFVAQGEGRAA